MHVLLLKIRYLVFLAVISGGITSCASYQQRIGAYHVSLARENFAKANRQIDQVKMLKKQRNEVLYLMEKGRILHLLGNYDSSNILLNEADFKIEDQRNNVKDIFVTGFLNPMLRQYQPEDFEVFMLHYYKALNYLFLGNTEDAVVEARRISLSNYRQEENGKNKQEGYNADAFSLLLQGLIYEKAGQLNNAFIAYRNATDIYLKQGDTYGTPIPAQLKKDLLRSAYQLGFQDELQRYETLLGEEYIPEAPAAAGEAIIFWETGLAPAKAQEMIQFNTVLRNDHYYFEERTGRYNIPFNYASPGYHTGMNLNNLQMFAIVLPRYEVTRPRFTSGEVLNNNLRSEFEKVQDLNKLSVALLKQRFVKELGIALSRMAVKKLTELALTPKDDKDKIYKTQEEKKKAERKKDQQEMLALGLKIFNRATEKADTRNWQSLPGNILYSRVPLHEGQNNLQIQLQGQAMAGIEKTISLHSGPGLQFAVISSME